MTAETGVKVLQSMTCVEEIRQWMSANCLKLNKDKTQFIWLGARLQVSKVQCQNVTIGGTDIEISTEAMCLGVSLDCKLTFAPHIWRLSVRCCYHLWQMRTVHQSLTEDAAKTMVHAFVTSRIDYYNSNIHRSSAAHIRPLPCTQCSCSTCVAQAEV